GFPLRKAELQRDYNSQQAQMNSCLLENRSLEEELEFVRTKKSKLESIKSDLQSNLEEAKSVTAR
ncbi:hypothetical protein, partial [Pseudogracilibacillus sp. SO30301A]|uniref:hypothetical protein n=1 Tax=Pseudogracilibacillus sp. SO30301A TaxID=3098291 RepID=UPI00300E22E3